MTYSAQFYCTQFFSTQSLCAEVDDSSRRLCGRAQPDCAHRCCAQIKL